MNNEQKLSPAPQNEVYRWVKASKRLPKKLNKDYPIRLDGEVYESGFFNRESYGTPFYSRGDRTNEMGEWEFNRIEWLERVEPQPQEQEKDFGSQQHSLDCNSVATLRSSSCNSIRHSENIGG
jgi:hypothetical protein